MRMKRLLAMLLICLLFCPSASFADGGMSAIANRVPVTYISDAAGAADMLMDDNAATVWYGTVDVNAETPTWTVLVGSQTVKEIWIRNGARQDPGSYLAAGRVKRLDVTIYYANQQVSTYRYQLNDAYSAETSRDWMDGYQRLLLPTAMNGVFCIELRVRSVTPGSSSQEIALSDILLSSGQPSAPASGVQMRSSAPTVAPKVTATPVPAITANPTGRPQTTTSVTNAPTMPPSSGSSVGQTATLLRDIGVRSGPGTGYDYVGTFFQAGAQVQVISKVWDSVNNLYWYYVDFTSGNVHYRGYCVQEYRVNLDPSLVPDEQAAVSATILERTANYYGPGTDYKAHNDQIFATTTGTVHGNENGYVLFDWYDGRNQQLRRAWIPASTVSIAGQ